LKIKSMLILLIRNKNNVGMLELNPVSFSDLLVGTTLDKVAIKSVE